MGINSRILFFQYRELQPLQMIWLTVFDQFFGKKGKKENLQSFIIWYFFLICSDEIDRVDDWLCLLQ